jgi:hypothetical protein
VTRNDNNKNKTLSDTFSLNSIQAQIAPEADAPLNPQINKQTNKQNLSLTVFRILLVVNSDYCLKQLQPVDCCNGEVWWSL